MTVLNLLKPQNHCERRRANKNRDIDWPQLTDIPQAEKNKSRSGSPGQDELSGEQDDGGDMTGGEDEEGNTDLEQDPNETMEDYEAALDGYVYKFTPFLDLIPRYS